MFRFRELSVPITKKEDVQQILARTLRIDAGEIKNLTVERFSLDSRQKNALHFSYTLCFNCTRDLSGKRGVELWTERKEAARDVLENTIEMPELIHVVGAGPAGLWAAYSLAQKGFKIILHEQGKMVPERFPDIRKFFNDRIFNPHSNVLFGEGGAGAFSDGKLNTRSRNFFSQKVLEDMVSFGMPKEILTFAKPHLGTDRLALLLKAMRSRLTELGVTLRFGSVLEDIEIQRNAQSARVTRARFNGHWEETPALVLATGHSARNIYELLAKQNVALESKAFAVGVRVEHPQTYLNDCRLGKNTNTRLTGSAEYTLTAKTLNNTSAAYSFCMCPGGVLVPCASEPGTLATNGMSHSHRRGKNGNGAIVVPVSASKDLFGGIELQRQIETKAFDAGNKTYAAPAQTIRAFLENKTDSVLPNSTYPCGLVPFDVSTLFPQEISDSLREGFLKFERTMPGFIQNGLIVAPETRTSSPLRILRNPDTLESINTKGLFVLGEGAGYSGGIVTSAADGIKLGLRSKRIKNG